jgi:hypothetical protein
VVWDWSSDFVVDWDLPGNAKVILFKTLVEKRKREIEKLSGPILRKGVVIEETSLISRPMKDNFLSVS